MAKRNYDPKEISRRLQAAMEEKQMSDKKLAKLAQVNIKTVRNAKKGESLPFEYTIGVLADALGVTIEDLTGVKGDAGRMEMEARLHICN